MAKLLKQLTKLAPDSPLLGASASSKALRAEIKKVKASQKDAAAAALSTSELEEEGVETETSDGASAAEDDEECSVVEMTIDGVTYLYDEAGDYAGVAHLLLTPEGTPIGVYDVELGQVELKEFTFDE